MVNKKNMSLSKRREKLDLRNVDSSSQEAFRQWWGQMTLNRKRLRKKRHGHLAVGEGASLADTILAQRKVKDDLPLGTSATQLYREELHNRRHHSSAKSHSTRPNEDTSRHDTDGSESQDDLSESSTAITSSKINNKNRHASEGTRASFHTNTHHNRKETKATTTTFSQKTKYNRTTHTASQHSTVGKGHHSQNPTSTATNVNRQAINSHIVEIHGRNNGNQSQPTREDSHNDTVSTDTKRASNKKPESPGGKYNTPHISAVPARDTEPKANELSKRTLNRQKGIANTDDPKDKSIDGSTKSSKRQNREILENRESGFDGKRPGQNRTEWREGTSASSDEEEGENADRQDTGYTSADETPPTMTAPPKDSDNRMDNQQHRHPGLGGVTSDTKVKGKSQHSKPLTSNRGVKTDPKDHTNGAEGEKKPKEAQTKHEAHSSLKGATPVLDKANIISWDDSDDDTEKPDASRLFPPLTETSKHERLPAKSKDSNKQGSSDATKLPHIKTAPRPERLFSQRVISPWAQEEEPPEIPSHLKHLSNDYVPMRVSSLPEHSTNDKRSMAAAAGTTNMPRQLARRHSGPSSRKLPRANSGPSVPPHYQNHKTNTDVDRMEKQVDKVLGDIIEKYSHG